MFDITLRPLKDTLFNPLCKFIPDQISPLQITALASLSGLLACLSAATNHPIPSVTFWLLNRILDCLDGALARHRSQASDLGGFLDLLGDFIVYSLIPISCGLGDDARKGEMGHLWLSVAVVEACFHVNNFVLFYVAAVVEKRRAEVRKDGSGEREEKVVKELTSLSMRPALVEGTESAVLFTLMLVMPRWTEGLCWAMAGLVGVGVCQRVGWVVTALA